MKRSILIVEPNSSRSKQIVHMLIQADYDVFVTAGADNALRQLFQARPNAVILSDRLSVAELDRLSDSITAMVNLPLIQLGNGAPLATVARRLTCSTGVSELVVTLNKVLEEGVGSME